MAYGQGVAALHDVRASESESVAEAMDQVVGNLDHLEVIGQQILVGVFIRPTKRTVKLPNGTETTFHTGGTGKEAVEDVYQGKICRVLKIGPEAFPSKYHGEWGGADKLPVVGEWLVMEAKDGMQVSVQCPGSVPTDMFSDISKLSSKGGWPCRLVFAADIRGRVSDPSVLV